MNIDDMVIVSIDDHVVEPPDVFHGRLPKKLEEFAPHVETDDKGIDRWLYRGNVTGMAGLNAVVSWPPEDWGLEPAGFAEMRPGAYDVHQRVRDMDRNGITASMCFPTFAGFSAGHFRHAKDDITNAMISAYNDWHIDGWCGAYPDRFIPLGIVPSWDREAMIAEIKRLADRGCHAVTMPELPHLEGTPSYHDLDYWGPVWQTFVDCDTTICMHIGSGFGVLNLAPNAPIDNLMVLACQISTITAQDLLWGPAFRTFPGLRVAFSEGGIGWIPFFLDRCDRHYTNQKWLRRDFGSKMPSEVFREHALACYVTDKTAIKNRHDVGIDIIAWECDFPHSDSIWPNAPEFVKDELDAGGCTDDEIDKITWKNASRFFNYDPFQGKSRSEVSVGTLRARATDVDTSIRSRKEWAKLYHAAHA